MSGWDAIIGHARNVEVLRRAIQTNKLAHAYLFAGPEGVGKRTVARALAATLNCERGGDAACGVCRSCRQMASGAHLDYREVEKGPPEKGKKLEDERQYKVARIREVNHDALQRPNAGRFKIFVFDEAEAINPEASNALLKTLEEPKPWCLFVLITPVPHQLLPTIVSRCQTLRFGALAEAEVRGWVAENLTLDADDADLVAMLAEGSIGRAEKLDPEFLRVTRPRLFAALAEAAGKPTAAALAVGEVLFEVDAQLDRALDLLVGFVRDATVWRLTGDARRLRNRDAAEAVARYATGMTVDGLAAKMRSLVFAQRLVERNVSKAAIADGLVLDLLSRTPTTFAEGRLPR